MVVEDLGVLRVGEVGRDTLSIVELLRSGSRGGITIFIARVGARGG
jgi:hypothetical protein